MTVTNTASPKTASAKTAVGCNRQPSSNNVNDNAMSDEESSQFSLSMNDNDEENLNSPRNTVDRRVWNTAADLGESEYEQKVSFTEQVEN